MEIKKRGRPRISTGKDGRTHVRTTEENRMMLDYLAKKTGKSKTDIIFDAVRAQYNYERFLED